MKNSLVMVVGGVGLALVAGCVGPRASVLPDGRGTEIRGSAAVAAGEARPLVAGPIRLLHANTDGRTVPKFSRVWVRSGAGDCRKATALEWDGATAVQIQKDELICVQTSRSARVSWHARAVSTVQAPALRQASLR
jgi:hypothetical protein